MQHDGKLALGLARTCLPRPQVVVCQSCQCNRGAVVLAPVTREVCRKPQSCTALKGLLGAQQATLHEVRGPHEASLEHLLGAFGLFPSTSGRLSDLNPLSVGTVSCHTAAHEAHAAPHDGPRDAAGGAHRRRGDGDREAEGEEGKGQTSHGTEGPAGGKARGSAGRADGHGAGGGGGGGGLERFLGDEFLRLRARNLNALVRIGLRESTCLLGPCLDALLLHVRPDTVGRLLCLDRIRQSGGPGLRSPLKHGDLGRHQRLHGPGEAGGHRLRSLECRLLGRCEVLSDLGSHALDERGALHLCGLGLCLGAGAQLLGLGADGTDGLHAAAATERAELVL
mmetsp:Transcript_96720/g.260050  ORF Transcript_96720/g.260050 Transcript_96720/m.260050 type:complete len:338 (+) Transcript_96720:131-1144(+)